MIFIGINANMLERLCGCFFWRLILSCVKGVTLPGNRRARKIQGLLPCITHHFDDIGVKKTVSLCQGGSRRGHARLGIVVQLGCYLVDEGRINEWLVALHINDDFLRRQVQYLSSLGNTIGTCFMRLGTYYSNIMALGGLGNCFAICSDINPVSLRAQCLASGTHNQGNPVDIDEHFVFQAGRFQAGRDENRKRHALFYSSWVGLISRASSSSMMGMPSRTGNASLSALQMSSCSFSSYCREDLHRGHTKTSRIRLSMAYTLGLRVVKRHYFLLLTRSLPGGNRFICRTRVGSQSAGSKMASTWSSQKRGSVRNGL